MIQDITGGMFKSMQSENHEETRDANGNVPVFTFGIDNNSADTQMQLNQKGIGRPGAGCARYSTSAIRRSTWPAQR